VQAFIVTSALVPITAQLHSRPS